MDRKALIEHFHLKSPPIHYTPFFALKEVFAKGYSKVNLRSDIMAGIVVGMVALPLSMSLAISAGAPPQNGLYTAIIAGFITALMGGSKAQVTGPTAAFVPLLFPIVLQHGLSGLLLAGLMAGILLVLMGLSGLGKFIKFIPYPVTVGFSSGIALVIFSIQLKDFFGLKLESTSHFLHRVSLIYQNMNSVSFPEFFIAACTLAGLILWPRISKKIPAPLIILPIITLIVWALDKWAGISIATIEKIFTTTVGNEVIHGIPRGLPNFQLPWKDFITSFSSINFAVVKSLMMPAAGIALLGAIESLLSAVVADAMTKSKHDPDSELVALGVGNIFCSFFGGVPATGALARTSTNIKFGAHSPIAAMTHALFILISILIAAPIISYLPMSALAALLVVVAYNMSEWHRFVHIVKVGHKSDVFVLITCFGLTVVFDMVIGVAVGVMLALVLFIRRMMELSQGEMCTDEFTRSSKVKNVEDVIIYRIIGPMFFGAADKTLRAINDHHEKANKLILLMDHVWSMDMTGLVSFTNTLQHLREDGLAIALVGLHKNPEKLLKKAHILDHPTLDIHDFSSVEEAITYLNQPKPETKKS